MRRMAGAMRSEETWVPMRDGTRLAATLYLPEEPGPHSPLLEYLPYRKDDGLLERDLDLYTYVTRRGYVGARVDIRGTGRSEGRLPNREYSEEEQRDAEDVIAWLAAQPWSSGRVGMWGISWGGFNAIHMAMRQPPALAAIVAIDASDDLFRSDVHYIDGMMHVDEYELMIDLLTAMSPAPDFPLNEAVLAARFDAEPWLLPKLRHQRDGPYWRRGSLRPAYERLGVPALLIGGWYDGYRDSVPRMLAGARVPVKAVVGPWDHSFPHRASFGPAIEWRREAVRWWERWLKGEENGVENEPRLDVHIRGWHPPDLDLGEIPGAWRSLEGWPVDALEELSLFTGQGGSLDRRRGAGGERDLPYVPSVGAEAGAWWGDLAPDQSPLDDRCLVYETEPLRADLEVLGFPRAELRASADAPLANWFARLCDVAPDGRSTLVSGGGLSGAHRDSVLDPRPLVPGEPYDLVVPMRFTSWVFPAGHRVRLAVSNALWPMVWPTPHPVTSTLQEGASRVVLPIPPAGDPPRPSFAAPEPPDPVPGVRSVGSILPVRWRVEREGESVTASWEGTERLELPWGTERFSERLAFEVDERRPARASVRGLAETTIELTGRTLRYRGVLDLGSDEQLFRYRFRRELHENGRLVRRREWAEDVPRDHQ